MLNLAKQSDAIGSPLSQPDRRVHKKVHLHNDARARDLPELRWVRCAPTSASRENAPFGCSSPSMPPPPPDTGRCVALSSAISPSSWGRTIIRSQLSARSQPRYSSNGATHSISLETNGAHHSFNIRSPTLLFSTAARP